MNDIEFCYNMRAYLRELNKLLKRLYMMYPKHQRFIEQIYNIVFNMEADIITYCEEKGVR